MDISGEYRLSVRRPRVWEYLVDPDTLRLCIPGCESLEMVQPDRYRARVKTVIGPVRATFDTELEIKDAVPPERYRLEGESKGGVVGFGHGHAQVTLEEDGDGTILRYSAAFQVGGRLAQLGSRLVVGATRKIADDFFAQLAGHIDSNAERLDEPRRQPKSRAVVLTAAAIVIALLAWWLWTAQ